MKNAIYTFAFIFCAFTAIAQAPQKFNYQAVARDNMGIVLPNKNVKIRASILEGSPNGTSQYTETQSATTSQLGLFNLAIGGGANFANITWASGDKYLKIEMDATGGNNFTLVGTSQLLSVPYALNAKKVEIESQMLSINGNNLSISSGNSVTLPSGGGIGVSTLHIPFLSNTAVNALSIVSESDGSKLYVFLTKAPDIDISVNVFQREAQTGQYFWIAVNQIGNVLTAPISEPILVGNFIYFIVGGNFQAIARVDKSLLTGGVTNFTQMNLVGSSFTGTTALCTDGNDLLIFNQNSASWVRHTISGTSLTNAGVTSGAIPSNSTYIFDGTKIFTYSDGIVKRWANANTLELSYERKLFGGGFAHLVNSGGNYFYLAYQAGTNDLILVPITKQP